MTQMHRHLLDSVVASLLSHVPSGLEHGPLRIGIDLVNVGTLESQLASRLGAKFRDRIFTPHEVTAARGATEKYATRWAVKEAVAKAIGTGFRQGLRPRHIEVLTETSGAIQVRRAEGAPSWPADADEWRWAVSASHESGFAVGVALAAMKMERDERQVHP